MGRKLLKTVQTITTFRNPLADPVGTRRGPPLVRGPQFENRCLRQRPHNKALVPKTTYRYLCDRDYIMRMLYKNYYYHTVTPCCWLGSRVVSVLD